MRPLVLLWQRWWRGSYPAMSSHPFSHWGRIAEVLDPLSRLLTCRATKRITRLSTVLGNSASAPVTWGASSSTPTSFRRGAPRAASSASSLSPASSRYLRDSHRE